MANTKRGEITVDGFEGLNELLSPFDLGDAEGNWLVEADNVDVDDGKSVRRRPGTTKIGSYTSPHSLWSDGEKALFAAQGTLYKVNNINASSVDASSIITGAGASRFGYAKLHDQIYFSNEKKNGLLQSDGTFHSWGVETPSNQPTLSTVTGALNIDHSISVFVTFIDDLGRESGAEGIATLQTDSETGVRLTNIPVPSSSDIDSKAIYCTPPDGDQFYLVDIIDTDVTTYNITNFSHKTILTETLFLSEPPKGTILASESGKIWVANGKYLYFSQPLRPHLFKMREDYFAFPADISIIAAVSGGLYIAADKTYYIDTTQDIPSLEDILPYGAVPGTVTEVSAEKLGEGQGIWAGWVGETGYVVGGPGGRIRNLTEGKTEIADGVKGGSFLRDDDGYTRLISTVQTNTQSSAIRATDYVTATVTKCPAQSTENTADNYYYTADTTTITADAA